MELESTICYRALLSRDRRFDGRFFVGVKTTGVYCRPVCPAPSPRRENVEFFACAAAAEAAGFRPCLRCRPETSPGTPAWLGSSAVVSRALRLIGAGALDEGDVQGLANRLGVGARQLRRLFVKHLGASPAAVARARRLHFARTLLDDRRLPVTEVAFAAGFGSIRQFNHAFRSTFGRSPRGVRAGRRGPGRTIASGRLAVRLPYRPPLDWPAMLRFLAARATPGVEVVADDHYRRTVETGGDRGAIEVGPSSDGAALALTVHGLERGDLLGVVERVRRIFDLDADPLALARHLRQSPPLAAIVDAAPGLRVPGAWDPFELAVRAVLGQQVSVRSATTLAGRLVTAFGERVDLEVAAGLTHLFPRPERLAEADVASIGLPRSRAETVRALARAVASGALLLDAPLGLEDAVARLSSIPGIGAWTAHYVAMRALGEPDAFPASDLGLRRAAGNGRGPVSPAELARLAEAWRPWRAYAALALWSTLAPRRQP